MANLGSVRKAFEAVGTASTIVDRHENVRNATHLVLPGVGAFGDAMKNIRTRGIDTAILEAIEHGAAFLGICLGLQVLFTESEEKGIHEGLDVFKGSVHLFRQGIVPQIGWNQAHIKRENPLLKGIPNHSEKEKEKR